MAKSFSPRRTLQGAVFGPQSVEIPPLGMVRVTVLAKDQQGNFMAGAPVTVMLDRPDIDPDLGYIVPEEMFALASKGGIAKFFLWPNARGNQESRYIFQIENPDTGSLLAVSAVVPNNSCMLHDIAVPLTN